MKYKIAVCSSRGRKRRENQDSLLVKTAWTEQGTVLLAAVCDGMGGLSMGEMASALLIHRLCGWFEEGFPLLLKRKKSAPGQGRLLRACHAREELLFHSLERLLEQVNGELCVYGQRKGIQVGTTATIFLAVGNRYVIAQVGDSRAYEIRSGIRQLTRDQTLVQRELEAGRITQEEAIWDPRRSILLQCIGAEGEVYPDFYRGRLGRNSMFLLCSDGFWHVVSKEELCAGLSPGRLKEEADMQRALEELTGLIQKRKEQDDSSAVLIRSEAPVT
ncbi:MAG: serine/threonine-protein phosphatase [Lachnospiraceae bacterium]|nr:serine/threonine-protein phosphatase [Lachnospiraceae bacterium]